MKDRSFDFSLRPHTPLAERLRWVARYERSGLSAEAFASKHGLNVWTLRGWIAKIRPRIQTPTAEPPAVQEVKLPLPEMFLRPPAPHWVAEVQWTSGTVVRLAGGLAARETETLLQAIRNVC